MRVDRGSRLQSREHRRTMEVDSQASLIAAERRPIGAGLLQPIDSVRRTEAAVYQASLATQRAVSETAPPLSCQDSAADVRHISRPPHSLEGVVGFKGSRLFKGRITLTPGIL